MENPLNFLQAHPLQGLLTIYTKIFSNPYLVEKNSRKKMENHEAAMKICIYCKNYNYC